MRRAAPKSEALNRERVRFEVAGRKLSKYSAILKEGSDGSPPNRSDKDHRAALAEIDAYWGAAEGTEEGDRLDVLLALVEIYEAKRWPIDIDDSFDPIDVLGYVIDELGHTQDELAEILCSHSRASEILSRRRALTVDKT